MASAKLRAKCGEIWIEVECQCVTEGFEALAEYLEIFTNQECGVCKNIGVLPITRSAPAKDGKTYTYHEMKCLSCGAKLEFGKTDEGRRLFPRRKNKDNSYRENMGWYQWQGTQSSGDYSQTEGGF